MEGCIPSKLCSALNSNLIPGCLDVCERFCFSPTMTRSLHGELGINCICQNITHSPDPNHKNQMLTLGLVVPVQIILTVLSFGGFSCGVTAAVSLRWVQTEISHLMVFFRSKSKQIFSFMT